MNELKVFENTEFGKVRTIMIDGNPYFVGKDVAEILEYSDSSSAVSKNVDNEDKTTLLLEQDGSNYKSRTTLINESGLYSLILGSNLPTSKKFQKWVTSEVLPSIRTTGAMFPMIIYLSKHISLLRTIPQKQCSGRHLKQSARRMK